MSTRSAPRPAPASENAAAETTFKRLRQGAASVRSFQRDLQHAQRMPKLGLKKDNQHDAGADRRRMKNPDGDHKIEPAGDQRARFQRENADGDTQRTRIAAPT